jgi:hypothetical protein
MAIHPHGQHDCQCVKCNYTIMVDEGVKCNTLTCPNDGTRLRAVDTGEYRSRISQGESRSIFWPILGASIISGLVILFVNSRTKK